MSFKSSVQIALLALFGTGFAQTVDGSKYNSPTAGPPASYFAAATTIPIAALQTAAAKASTAAQDATYPINGDSGAKKVTIHSDWSNFSEVCEPVKPNTKLSNLMTFYRAQRLSGLQIWMWTVMVLTISARWDSSSPYTVQVLTR
jgi:hypothetical protein